MKTNLLKSLLCGAALLASVAASAQKTLPADVRNYFAVTGYTENGDPVTISSTVKFGFDFEIQLADPSNATVAANKATIEVGINDVNTLGALGETRYHEKTLTSDVNFEGDLSEFLSSAYTLGDLQVPVKVIDGSEVRDFTYSIAHLTNDYKIIGTPSSYNEAYDAWKMITDRVVSKKKSIDDSYFSAKAKSYIQFGDERMYFTNDVDLFVEPWNKTEELGKITSNISVLNGNLDPELANMSVADTYKPVICLKAGTALAVGQSIAVLQKDAKITMDLSAIAGNTKLTKQISSILNEIMTSSARSKTAILVFFRTFNGILDMIHYAGRATGSVPVTVEFSDADANLDIYTVEGCTQNQTEEDFQAVKETYPNAMAVANYGQAKNPENILFGNSNGEYVCYYFNLTDLTTANGKSTDWYSPYDFYVVSGQYVRKNLPNGYASVCLPFAVNSDELNGSDILTYADYDGAYLATFVSGTKVEAGVPFMAYATGGTWEIDLQDKEVSATVANGNSTYGTYVKTTDYAMEYFGVNTSINKFARLASKLSPFRACLDLKPTVSNVKEISISRVATAIEKVQNNTEAQTIHTISGVKLNKISQPGLYIINGKKMFVK